MTSVFGHDTKLHPLLQSHQHNHEHSHNRNKIQTNILNRIKPEQIHISFGEKINDIVVLWASHQKMVEPYVEYGRDANLRKTMAEETNFTESNKDGVHNWYRAYLSDLRDNEQYIYRINSARGVGIISDQLSFTVPSLKKDIIHSVMILADMGASSKSLNFLVQEALNGGYEAVFHLGDIANDLHRGDGVIGDGYLRQIQKMAGQVAYMTCPGDQEKAHDYLHYRHRFSMPGSPWPMKDHLWYSFDLGNAHFVVINTQVLCSDHELKETQLSWIKNDLTIVNKAQRPKHPWIIMLGHKPLYSTCDKNETECSQDQPTLRKELEDIMYRYGVDVYIAGHQHNYERSWPVYRQKLFNSYNYKNPKAPIHITIGSMGAEYHKDEFGKVEHPWSALRYPGTHKELFGKLDIINASHIYWEVMSASNNEKVDYIWIVQNSHGTFGEPGDQAFERAKELEKIPLRPPLPPEPIVHASPIKTDTVKPIHYKFVSRSNRNPGVSGSAVLFFTCMVVFFLFMAWGRFRKSLFLMCRRGS